MREQFHFYYTLFLSAVYLFNNNAKSVKSMDFAISIGRAIGTWNIVNALCLNDAM